MAKIKSPRTERDVRALGRNLAAARRLHGLTAELVAERAGISRPTLRSIETGEGSARLENVMAVMRVLGLSDAVVESTSPLRTELGQLHAEESLPRRVRRQRSAV